MSSTTTEFFVGQYFDSFEDFKLHLQKYEVEKRQKFTIRASQSLESSSKFLKRKINLNLKYYEVQYQCVHRGGFKPSGTGLRKTSTLRMNCPALIKLRASSCGTKLEVKKVHELHEGHDLTEEVFEHLSHNRKLDNEEIVAVENYIELGADKKRIQHKLFSESSKKPLLKDLHNIATGLKRKQNNNLENVVELLEKTHNCNVSVLCSDLKEFKALYFSTAIMRQTMEAWPEFIAVDATYKLINNGCAVFLLLIEDSDGHSEIVGVCIAASEDKDTVEFFLNCFKSEHITACEKIRCFMGDKDFVERNVIKKIFPGIPTYICLFHSMKTFRREITETKCNISKQQRELSLEYIVKLIYAGNDSEYNEIYDQFVECVPKTVLKYFNDNWHNIRKEWTVYNMTNNFLNHTNNRLESINSKIKDVVKKSNSMSEFVKGFFIYLESHHYAREHFVAKHVQKRPVSLFEERSCEHKYEMYLTHYAFEYVLKQISLMSFVSIISNEDTECVVKSSSGSIKTNVDNCECRNYKSMLLPCKHMFAVRSFRNIPKFDKSICDQRWTREYYINNHPATTKNSAVVASKDVGVSQIPKQKFLTLTHKKKKMLAVTNSLCHLGSAASNSLFEYRLKILKEIELCWKQGIEVSVLGVNGQTDEDNSSGLNCENVFPQEALSEVEALPPFTSATLEVPLKEFSVNNEHGQSIIVNQEAGISSVTNISECNSVHSDGENEIENFVIVNREDSVNTYVMENQLSETSTVLSDLIMPVKVKKRGRPSGADTTVIGLKKKKKVLPTVFEKKNYVCKAEILLKCVLATNNTDLLNAILCKDYLVSENDLELRHEFMNDAVIDERVSIEILSPFLEKEAFKKLQQIIKTKIENVIWKCSSCHEQISTKRSISCDSCLQWHHFHCVALIRPPNKSTWFCYNCFQASSYE